MKKQGKNVLILYLSMYHVDPDKLCDSDIKYYRYLDEEVVKGIQTNEGPAKALIQHLGGKLDHIIYFASETVRNKCIETNKLETHSNKLFQEAIEKYMTAHNYCIPSDMFIPVNVQDTLEDREIISEIINVADSLSENDHVYIDLTGGQRQVAYMLLAISRILSLKDVCLEAVFTTDFNNEKEYTKDDPLDIMNNKSVFQSTDYVNAVNMFFDTGKVKLLKEWFDNFNIELTGEEKEILKCLEDFYRNIRLCKVNGCTEKWEKVIEAIHKYRQKENGGVQTKEFQFIVEILEKKMEKNQNNNDFNVINWCLDNELLQQAITIFNEKIPMHILSKLKIEKNEEKAKKYLLYKYPKSVNKDHKASYKGIFKELEECNEEDGKFLKGLYLLIDAIRDHANHASEDKEKNDINEFLEIFYEKMKDQNKEWSDHRKTGIVIQEAMYNEETQKVNDITEIMDNEDFIIGAIRCVLMHLE